MDAGLAAAVIDNARWCHLVCATQGIAGRFDEDAWVSPRRTPPMYPDAVTLRPDVMAEPLLARIDRGVGCSVKDSFATLDLADAGFQILFDAEWIQRVAGPSPSPGDLAWDRVGRSADLRLWAHKHGAGATFTTALLAEPSVTILAGRDRSGRLQAGAVATEGEAAVGISNVFVAGADGGGVSPAYAEAFAGATAAIVERFPGRAIVGYLSAATVGAARAAGFGTIAPLRIWLRDGP